MKCTARCDGFYRPQTTLIINQIQNSIFRCRFPGLIVIFSFPFAQQKPVLKSSEPHTRKPAPLYPKAPPEFYADGQLGTTWTEPLPTAFSRSQTAKRGIPDHPGQPHPASSHRGKQQVEQTRLSCCFCAYPCVGQRIISYLCRG